jgi:hypothetical protein
MENSIILATGWLKAADRKIDDETRKIVDGIREERRKGNNWPAVFYGLCLLGVLIAMTLFLK